MKEKIKKLLPAKKTKEDIEKDLMISRQNTAQQWIPIKDIYEELMYFKDDSLAIALKVQPINIHLLSEAEQKVKVQGLFEALNGADYSLQIYTVARPVDLDGYIAKLRTLQSKETDFIKRKLYSGSIQVAAQKATSGEALERDFYIIIRQKNEKYAEELLKQKAGDLATRLSGAGLATNICSDQELRDLNFIFTHPAQAAIEKAPQDDFSLPTAY